MFMQVNHAFREQFIFLPQRYRGLIQLSKHKCLMEFEMSEIILLYLQLQLQQDASLLQLLCRIWQTCANVSDALKHLNWLKVPVAVQLN